MSSGLDTRPGATTLGLDELVELAWSGKIRVPHFQRDFRWTSQDIIRLFDSIFLRYPVGSLLLWRRPARAQRIRLGALEIDAPEVDDARWVVDGQQRLTTLANVLHPDGGRRDRRFALGYNLREKRVVPLPAIDDPTVIPLWVVFDLGKVLAWFADHPEIGEHRDTAFALAKHLREFSVPAYQVVQDNVDVLVDIFDRMNNYGKRLSRAEIFSALNAGSESAADDRLTLDRIAEEVNAQLNFGKIDSDTVLRAILARRGPDVQREIRLEFDDKTRTGVQDFRHEDKESAFTQGQEALVRAVMFVVATGVPHFTLLPYRYLLIVLTRLFAHHPDPDPTNERLLSRWFWRAAVFGPGVFKGGTTGAMRILCGKIRPHDLTGSVHEMLESLPSVEPAVPDLRRFRTNEAAAQITLCSWWTLGPRNPGTGRPYEQFELADALVDRSTAADAVHSLFPHRQLPEGSRLWAANRVLMPALQEPVDVVTAVLLQRPLDLNEQEWHQVLHSHSITPAIEDMLAANDVEKLMKARQVELAGVLESFLKRKCEWGFENTPPLAEMVLEDLPDEEGDDAA